MSILSSTFTKIGVWETKCFCLGNKNAINDDTFKLYLFINCLNNIHELNWSLSMIGVRSKYDLLVRIRSNILEVQG